MVYFLWSWVPRLPSKHTAQHTDSTPAALSPQVDCPHGRHLPEDSTSSACRLDSKCSIAMSSRDHPALSRFRTTLLMILPPRLLKEMGSLLSDHIIFIFSFQGIT